MDDVFVGLPGREMQWVFDKRRAFGEAASHLSLVASGADALVGADTATLVALAAREVAASIPGARDADAEARHRHPREARHVLPGARRTGPARRRDTGAGPRSSPATGSKPGFRAQSRAQPPQDICRGRSPIVAICARQSQSSIGNLQSAMKSVVIHYGEIALKGKNRPWFVTRLARNIREATSDLDIAEVRVLMGRIELVLGPEADLGTGERTHRPRLRHRQLRARRARAARRRRDRHRDPERPRAREPGHVPRVGQARRQALSPELPRDRARGRRPHQGSAQLDREPRQSGVHDSRRGADARSVLLLRHRPRPRRASRRRQRPRGVPPLGRHRFAGRGLAHAAPRLPRPVHPLSQLSDPVARVAGEGPGAGEVCSRVTSSVRGSSSCPSARSSSASCSPSRPRSASSSTAA